MCDFGDGSSDGSSASQEVRLHFIPPHAPSLNGVLRL